MRKICSAMRTRKLVPAAIAMMFLYTVMIVACSPKKDEATPNVSLKKDLLPIFQASCAVNGSSCHIGSSATNNHVDLSDSMAYATIIDRGLVYPSTPTASMLYTVLATGRMPKDPYPKLSAAQVKLVLNWIQQGAKNN